MLTSSQQHCLHGIGISRWILRPPGAPLPGGRQVTQGQQIEQVTTASEPIADTPGTAVSPPVQAKPEPLAPQTLHDWTTIDSTIEACTRCALAQSCTRKVPGKGDRQADLMIIGEAPGRDEDLQGKPFVGRAGQLLDRMLQAIEIDPAQVFITNILKCRPPNNRDPLAEEVAACKHFLQAQIKQLQPKVIFSVGRISAQNLLQDHSPVGRLRGQQHQMPDTDLPLLVSYHPAYLLRNPAEKAKVWQDLKNLRQLLKKTS